MFGLRTSRLLSKSAPHRMLVASTLRCRPKYGLFPSPWSPTAQTFQPVRRFMATSTPSSLMHDMIAADEEEYSVQDHLLQLEKEVELYFRHLAEHVASTPGIKKILNRLADDEAAAYRFIEDLPFNSVPYLQKKGAIVEELRPIFQTMSIENLTSDDRDEIRVYEKARDAKARLRDLYLSKAEKCQDPKGQTLLRMAAKEADRHFEVLDGTVEYLAKAEPGSGRWAECAEFFFVDNSQFNVSLERY